MSREIDALVAEHVFGYRREKTPKDIHGEFGGEDVLVPPTVDHTTYHYPPKGRIALTYFVKNYSSDISAAWEVVERMKTDDWSFRFSNNAWANGQQAAAFFKAVNAIGKDILAGDYVYEDNAWVIADSAPLAICKAALKAKGVTEGRGE
jgi:hypothetical protein